MSSRGRTTNSAPNCWNSCQVGWSLARAVSAAFLLSVPVNGPRSVAMQFALCRVVSGCFESDWIEGETSISLVAPQQTQRYQWLVEHTPSGCWMKC